MSAGALDGLRVIDLTHHLGGPLATMALAQMGADVIKVEPPDGDQWRHVDDVAGESRVFHAVNRDKRGIVLDLQTAEGRDALHALVAGADVVAHSFAPGVAERLGAGAEELTALNPRLVHCSLSAFGPEGRRGTDVALQSESGLVTANGGRGRAGRRSEGRRGGAPGRWPPAPAREAVGRSRRARPPRRPSRRDGRGRPRSG